MDTQGKASSFNITLVPIANVGGVVEGGRAEYLVTEFKRDLAIGDTRVRITPMRIAASQEPDGDQSGAIAKMAADIFGFTHFATNHFMGEKSYATLQGVSADGAMFLGLEEFSGGYQFHIEGDQIRAVKFTGGLSDIDLGMTATLWSTDPALMTLALQGGVRFQGAFGLKDVGVYSDASPYSRVSAGGRY